MISLHIRFWWIGCERRTMTIQEVFDTFSTDEKESIYELVDQTFKTDTINWGLHYKLTYGKLAAIPEEEPDEIDRKMIEMVKKENSMSECCKETMCTTCIHQDICSVKEKFLDAQKAVDGLVVYDKLPDGKLGQVKLRDIGFIKPVELECIHYVYKGSAGVKGGLHV